VTTKDVRQKIDGEFLPFLGGSFIQAFTSAVDTRPQNKKVRKTTRHRAM